MAPDTVGGGMQESANRFELPQAHKGSVAFLVCLGKGCESVKVPTHFLFKHV